MSQDLLLTEQCSSCEGTGLQPLPPPGGGRISCGMCGGGGRREISKITLEHGFEDLWDKCVDIKNKLDNTKDKVDSIKDKVDTIKSKVDDIWDKVKNL
jgi:DnaJ-class molecular chaperone